MTPGWVEPSESSREMSRLMEQYSCVLSTLYSSQCKLFFFPVRSIPSSWMRSFDFYLKNDKTELAYLIIKNNKAKTDPSYIIPAQSMNCGLIYKLCSKSTQLEQERRDNRRPSKIVSRLLRRILTMTTELCVPKIMKTNITEDKIDLMD